MARKVLVAVFLFVLGVGFAFPLYAAKGPLNLSLCFVVDASGSMRGNKLSAAKGAVRTTVGLCARIWG